MGFYIVEMFQVCCRKSLKRLGISKLGLYMIHWPGFITNGWCNDAFVQGLADCQQQGLTQAVGVSNFNLGRVKTAQQILKVTTLVFMLQVLSILT